MARPLPNCAYCGEPLRWSAATRKEGRILLHWTEINGVPQVGWHGECIDDDELFRPLLMAGNVTAQLRHLNAIDDRGRSRIVMQVQGRWVRGLYTIPSASAPAAFTVQSRSKQWLKLKVNSNGSP